MEAESLSCQQIDVEIAKVDGLLHDIQNQWESTSGRRFLGFLGDFGIGNHIEHRDAIESADSRRDALLSLRIARKCPGEPEARPEID